MKSEVTLPRRHAGCYDCCRHHVDAQQEHAHTQHE